MSNIRVCVRFRPLSPTESRQSEDMLCVKSLDHESFLFKDEKEDELAFCFDRVFYQDSEQEDVYEFLARPIVEDTVNLINGTIITYGQTGAGKTYTMEGPDISNCQENKKGLLPRVIDGLFSSITSTGEMDLYTVTLSMVEIHMEKVRDLLDLTKDNLQIKEGKMQGIFLSGVTEIPILDTTEALSCLVRGISNRTVGETQMNMSSSRSHCLYIFSVQKESLKNGRMKNGKLVLVDLAGSEKVEKTGAEGRVLEEAKTINKSLSALGNVVNALTSGKANHIPYRDSKLTRILQDALGGNSRCALLCCCSPSFFNASESFSTLRFGTRSKLLKAPSPVNMSVLIGDQKQVVIIDEENHATLFAKRNSSSDKILEKLRQSISMEDVDLLEELLISEGILFDPVSADDCQSAYEEVASRTISSLQHAVKELQGDLHKLRLENNILKAELAFATDPRNLKTGKPNHLSNVLDAISFLFQCPLLSTRKILIGLFERR